MRYLTVLLMLGFAGCATSADWAQHAIAEFGPYCEGRGYARDTESWRHCVQVLDARATAAADWQMQQLIQIPTHKCDPRSLSYDYWRC